MRKNPCYDKAVQRIFEGLVEGRYNMGADELESLYGGEFPEHPRQEPEPAPKVTGKHGIIDAVVLKDENDKPIGPDDDGFDEAVADQAPEGATHAYLCDAGQDDSALVVYSVGEAHYLEVARWLNSPDYKTKIDPGSVTPIDFHPRTK